MKNTFFTLLLVLACTGAAWSQQPAQVCDITITGSFDSECIYDFKEDVTAEYPDFMIACKHSTVVYTASVNNNLFTPSSYTWMVYGDVSHTASGNQLTVTWDNGTWGQVVVSVANAAGDVCAEDSYVRLIDNPTVGAVTVPAYTVDLSGDKIIYVCAGSTVQFIDNSTAEGGDIAGYNWSCLQAPPAATPNYTITDVQSSDVVHHSVYNNCGCMDEEEYKIVLLEGEPLELECFGTVCEGATVTYQALTPTCSGYYWYVDGGTLVGGQGTATPTVQWDRPAGGYGVIGLDGMQCGNVACPAMMSLKIPVIHSGLQIEGETDVCVGDAVLYTLPVFGSTKYKWVVSPVAGVDTTMKYNTNELRLVFNQAGTYTLQCSYQCDFLGCGPYDAEPLTITVRPPLEITGSERICVANACSLQTSPAVTAQWTAYNLSAGNTVAATGTGTAFSHTFATPGSYLVTAENAAYCGPATFVLTVAAPPPAPTVADLDPDNRHTACPNLGITLAGTPSEPNYSLVWAPACTTASPQMFSGDNVTISYQADVCDVYVYNYDQVLQCRSECYYVHQVTALTPAPLNLPQSITVCPGSLIQWGDSEIPDQSDEAMLYEWTMAEDDQALASVVGTHLDNGVTLAVSETNPIVSPLHVNLIRTFCGNFSTTYPITIYVQDLSGTPLSITPVGPVCVGDEVEFTGTGCNPSTYTWDIDGEHIAGNNIDHTFTQEGKHLVTLHCNPYTYCTNPDYLPTRRTEVVVNPLPMVEGLSVNYSTGNISVVPATLTTTDYDFAWTYRATAQSLEYPVGGNSSMITAQNPGTYSCTVTDKQTHCSRTVGVLYDVTPPPSCNTMTLTGTYDYCQHTLSLSAGQYSSPVTWSVRGGDYSIETSGTNNRYADITFSDIGIYTVTARSGAGVCYSNTWVQTVDFIPHFVFLPGCNKVFIKNRSQYAEAGTTVYITVTNDCTNEVGYITMNVDDTAGMYVPASVPGICTFTFTLTGYGVNNNLTPCVLGTVEIGHPAMSPGFVPVSVTSSNGNHTCENTPLQLTASLNYQGASIATTTWSFIDGSVLTTNGQTVFHTFSAGGHSVTATTTDNHGCAMDSNPIHITSHASPFDGNVLLDPQSNPICPYVNTIDILFPPGATYFEWWSHKDPTHVVYSNPYPTYQSDDYFVYATNTNNCKTQATTFVKFLNAPTASIYAEKYVCCVNEEMTLYGGQDPANGQVTYNWSVSGPLSFSQSGATPNIVIVPPYQGTYTATLTVTNPSGCSATTTATVTASTPAPAPTLSFVGNPCISDAPVQLSASGCTGEVHWSNGSTGTTALYYNPGIATAYCYDPAVGCPSQTAQIRIYRQPDFDALLTGCYQKCRPWFDGELPVYSLTDNGQTIQWDWRLNNTSLTTGNGTYFDQPLILPLTGYGVYNLVVNYGGSCSETSPALDISTKELCDCDDLEVTYSVEILPTEDCSLAYRVRVTVCDTSDEQEACLDGVSLVNNPTGIEIVYTDFASTPLPPNDCYSFIMDVVVPGMPPVMATFRLTDNDCMICEKDFNVNFLPEIDDCLDEMGVRELSVNTDLTSEVAAYFEFTLGFSPCDNIVALWSEPAMIFNYFPVGASQASGLIMIDIATLSQYLPTNEPICFHAIICCDKEMCHSTVCLKPDELCMMLEAAGVRVEGWNDEGTDMTPGRMTVPKSDIQLIPNPATGTTRVTGTTDEVAEILFLDMAGREAARFLDTDICDISTLPQGMYIVRVATRKDPDQPLNVTYLKLVKQ